MGSLKKISKVLQGISKHPLAGRHVIKAYYRFFGWQMSQLFFPGFKRKHFIENTYLSVKKGMTGATGNIYCGLHEFEDMTFLLHFLRKEDTFLDVGANIGSYTILSAGVCNAKTISFEPAPLTYSYLLKNIELNKLNGRVTTWNAAVGAEPGEISFTSGLDTVNHVLANYESEESVRVKVYALDDLIGREENVRLIKVDTEGFETEVLKGMPALLNNPALKAIIIELNGSGERYGFNENDIHLKLSDHGFLPYGYDPFLRNIFPLKTFNSYNTIYLRDREFVARRVQESRKIKIFSEYI